MHRRNMSPKCQCPSVITTVSFRTTRLDSRIGAEVIFATIKSCREGTVQRQAMEGQTTATGAQKVCGVFKNI